VPVIIAGGELTSDREGLLRQVESAVGAGAAGVAFGRNVWGSTDPAGMVRALRAAVDQPERRLPS